MMLVPLLCVCEQPSVDEVIDDLPQMAERGKITVATCNNAVNYFVHKGETMGFYYEVLTELGKHLGLKVEFLIGKSYAENLQMLAEKECDLVASGWLPTENDLSANDADTLYMSRQVLVQRKPDSRKKMTARESEESPVRQPENLNGKTVYASGWSALADGSDFVPDRHIRFVALEGVTTERLIRMVAAGELDYAVCDWSEARLFAQNFDQLDMKTVLGELPVGWIVRATSVELQQEIAQWLTVFKKSSKYAVLYHKYHAGATIRQQSKSKLFANRTGIISEYDDLFRKYSQKIGWDWRLLAALVYQESRFIHDARSSQGAYGLMQMMPATMSLFGIDATVSPDRHIAAGVAYIKYLDRMLASGIPDNDERIKFILASYNIGPGHVLDARRLAEKYGKNAEVWDDNVDVFLMSKSDPKYYNDPAVRHGKCYGKQTCAYVTQVMERYEHYKNILNM